VKATIDTGVRRTITVPLPKFGNGANRAHLTVKPTPIAIHDGDSEDDVRAFAQHLCDAWDAYRAKRWAP
jgi:hypothetical protein